MSTFFKAVTVAALGVALGVSSISYAAMEATAARKGAEANVANDIKLQTVTSALTTLFNDLKETVDGLVADMADLTARVVALETWRTNTVTPDLANIKTRQPSVWNPALENRIQTIENGKAATTVTNALNARLNTIEGKQPVSWNTPLENRLKALEASGSGPSLEVAKTVSFPTDKGTSTSSAQKYDLCVLSMMTVATSEDNHGHTCRVTGNPSSGFVLYRTSTKAKTACAMTCYNFQ